MKINGHAILAMSTIVVYHFDAELVENAIMKMKRGKAAGLDNITVEHLRFSH